MSVVLGPLPTAKTLLLDWIQIQAVIRVGFQSVVVPSVQCVNGRGMRSVFFRAPICKTTWRMIAKKGERIKKVPLAPGCRWQVVGQRRGRGRVRDAFEIFIFGIVFYAHHVQQKIHIFNKNKLFPSASIDFFILTIVTDIRFLSSPLTTS